MSSDLYGELTDAGRTALEIVRRERAGDLRGIVDLISTYGDDGKALVFGAMASVVNHALAAFDELARAHGEVLRSDDLLDAMAIGLQPPGTGLDPGRPGAAGKAFGTALGRAAGAAARRCGPRPWTRWSAARSVSTGVCGGRACGSFR